MDDLEGELAQQRVERLAEGELVRRLGLDRTPDAPFARATTVSLVESWPSTLMRSNERFTQTPVRRSSVSASSTASVWMKQNIVAWRGEIIPAPLAWAASLTAPASSATSRQARFGPASLVRMAVEKSSASASERSAGRAHARHHGVARSSTPITPVEATAT